MNWQMLGVIIAAIIAIGGGIAAFVKTLISALAEKYFQTLSDRILALEERMTLREAKEEAFQEKITNINSAMRDSLIRIETGAPQYVTQIQLNDAATKLTAMVTDSRHAMRNELQVGLLRISNDALSTHTRLEQKIDAWVAGCSQRRHVD